MALYTVAVRLAAGAVVTTEIPADRFARGGERRAVLPGAALHWSAAAGGGVARFLSARLRVSTMVVQLVPSGPP